MSAPDRLPDEALDGLLDGSPSDGAVGTPLAAYLSSLREDAASTTPQASQELTTLLAEGLDPAELETQGILTFSGGNQSDSGILTWRRRARTAVRVLVAKFAALGLLGKAAAASAAVTVAASGAGAAGVLPDDAQQAFNEVVGREVQEAPVNDAEDQGDAEVPPETPADTSTTEPLDTDVSDDATGSSDGEAGVDGGEIADDASDGESNVPEDPPAGNTDGNADVGEEAVDEAPSDKTPDDVPPTEPPANDTTSTDGGDVEERPDDPSESPTS